jgi:hypothetical protein
MLVPAPEPTTLAACAKVAVAMSGEDQGIVAAGWVGCLLAVTLMLIFYALEDRSAWFILAFAGACGLGSIYGFMPGGVAFSGRVLLFGAGERTGSHFDGLQVGFTPSCAGGHGTEPNEQKTQQLPGSGLSVLPQPLHS